MTELRAALERHQPAIWHDTQWDRCDPDHPMACCEECEDRFWTCDAARALAEIKRLEAALEEATPVMDATVLAGLAIHYYQHPTRKVGGKGCCCGETGAVVLDRVARAALEETKP